VQVRRLQVRGAHQVRSDQAGERLRHRQAGLAKIGCSKRPRVAEEQDIERREFQG
jgi:hypothetical protein